MQDEEFEWDDEKNRKNLKHLSFYDAKYVFNDPRRLTIPDINHGGEERWITIGLAEKLIFVAYTERGKRKRLISTRIATKVEEEIYNAGNIQA
ncbi:MAG: BrnT family toxin [Treponema sp.]|nr:BrnT family toxin [Treponema sp.]